MGNIKRWLTISIIISVLFGIITLFFTQNPVFAGYMIALIFIFIMVYVIFKRCSRCGNLGALSVINTKLLNSHQEQRHFTRNERVGTSVRRNRDGEEIDRTSHYQLVNYITTITTNVYEDTIECKYCGNISKKKRPEESTETHRC